MLLLGQSRAGAERCSRFSQGILHTRCERVRNPHHAPCGPFHLLERRHGFADIVECSAGVPVERPAVSKPHYERGLITLAENTPGYGYSFAQHRLGVFEAL